MKNLKSNLKREEIEFQPLDPTGGSRVYTRIATLEEILEIPAIKKHINKRESLIRADEREKTIEKINEHIYGISREGHIEFDISAWNYFLANFKKEKV